jgi:hypothetical protein
MDANDLGMLGLTTVTFAMPLLVLVADDVRKRRLSRRLVPKHVRSSRRTRFQAHPMAEFRRP